MAQKQKPNISTTSVESENDTSKQSDGKTSNDQRSVIESQVTLGTDLKELFTKDVSVEDLYEPILDRTIGIAANTAIAFGIQDISAAGLTGLLDNVNLLNNLVKEIESQNSLGGNICRITPSKSSIQDLDPEASDSAFSSCLEKSLLYQKVDAASESQGPVEIISNVFGLLSELSRPANPSECINPYFEQFFNLVPIQFLISAIVSRTIKEALGNLTTQEVEEALRAVEPCGQELSVNFSNTSVDFPTLELPLFKLPAIPSIPNVNLYTVLQRLIVEAVCYLVCVTFTPLLAYLSKEMLEVLNEFSGNERFGGTSNFTELVANSLTKIYLNDEIPREVLIQAILQNKVAGFTEAQIISLGKAPTNAKLDRNGFWRKPEKKDQEKALTLVLNLISSYFDEIYFFTSEPYEKQIFNPKTKKYELTDKDPNTGLPIRRELGTKEMVYMMLGEYNCFTISDLIKIGSQEKYKVLRLNTEKRIVEFYKFLGVDFNAIDVVNKLKQKACPPEPCEKADTAAIEQLNNKLSELCKLLNLKSGLPSIPINKILKAINLDQLFNDGIKEQFSQLKTEQLFYLGYPSIGNYPTTADLSPFPPPENNNLNDYELWTEQKVPNKKVFEEFLLRGGPPLQWKYDKYNLNKDLQDSTLDDVCGEEETFEETFAHILGDIFKINYAVIQQKVEQKQEDYKEEYRKKVQSEYERRVSPDNPCCKFKDVNFTITAEPGDDTLAAGPNVGDSDISILEQKVKDIYNEAKGAGSGTLGVLGFTLTREQRCWICKRKNIFSQDNKSLLAYIDSDGGEGTEGVMFKQALNCKEFGYNKIDGFGPIKEGSLASEEGKCPKV